MAFRYATLTNDNKARVSWTVKDPEFEDLLADMRALPNRFWFSGNKFWVCAISEELNFYLLKYDFDIAPDLLKLLIYTHLLRAGSPPGRHLSLPKTALIPEALEAASSCTDPAALSPAFLTLVPKCP